MFTLPRRAPAFPFVRFSLELSDGTVLGGRHAAHGRERLAVLAHPAVVGQDYLALTELAEMLYPDFDVCTFDFRGHGNSGGFLTPDMSGPVADLAAVLDHMRDFGYRWTGVVGFSLGGIAGIFCAAARDDIDALASIGAPPRMPETGLLERHPRLAPALLRLLGLRIRPGVPASRCPLDVVEDVSPTPLLLVHGTQEIFYPAEDFEALWDRAREPKARLVLEAGHAETGAEAHLIRDWLLEQSRGVAGSLR